MPGRSKAEGGKEGNDAKDEVRWVEKDVTNAVLIANLLDSTASGVLAGKIKVMGDVDRSSSSVLAGEPFQHVIQNWDSSQVEYEPEERDAMDWLMDDEIMKQSNEKRSR